MKRTFALTLIAASLALAACSEKPKQTSEQRVQTQLEAQHPLTDTERNLADANAKAYFSRGWPSNAGKVTQGSFIACRPSDSNANGLVTCTGYVGSIDDGHLFEQTRYCGYRPELVGCSDKDTVSPS